MGKILALDIGTKRIGYAVSDESQSMVFPRETFKIDSTDNLLNKIEEIVQLEAPSLIVIGIPLDRDNEDTIASLRIKKIGERIAKELGVKVEFVDEFGSSDEALSKIPFRSDRATKGTIDPLAAQIILQRYLDSNHH